MPQRYIAFQFSTYNIIHFIYEKIHYTIIKDFVTFIWEIEIQYLLEKWLLYKMYYIKSIAIVILFIVNENNLRYTHSAKINITY